jgi:hypothetical protein
MKTVLKLSERDLYATVQAGLGYVELNELLKSKGIWFPLDPGPGASIGGMCACRCSGSTAVRYGEVTKDNNTVFLVLLRLFVVNLWSCRSTSQPHKNICFTYAGFTRSFAAAATTPLLSTYTLDPTTDRLP